MGGFVVVPGTGRCFPTYKERSIPERLMILPAASNQVIWAIAGTA